MLEENIVFQILTYKFVAVAYSHRHIERTEDKKTLFYRHEMKVEYIIIFTCMISRGNFRCKLNCGFGCGN